VLYFVEVKLKNLMKKSILYILVLVTDLMCETLMPYIYGLACYIILQVVIQSFIIM